MTLINVRHLAVGLALLAAAGLALALTPREKVADHGPKIDLETMIPKKFGDWKIDEEIVPLKADPAQTALLNKLYNQILARTYVNGSGQRVMLSIAYGGDQSESMQVHKPEVCYPAQGFQMLKEADGNLNTGYGAIPVRHLVAAQGQRIEPITYWITIGERVAGSSMKWKLEQLKYGLTGKIPDGMIFRVSSISSDESVAYQVQDSFVKELLRFMSPADRIRFIGTPAS